jgi:hypothetical protein
MIKALKTVPYHEDDAPTTEFIGRDRRWALQTFGTEMVRRVWGEEFWVNHLRRRAVRRGLVYKSKYPYVVIDDVRFVNEAMICDAVIELARDALEYGIKHESERRLPFDAINKPYHYLRLQGGMTDFPSVEQWINNVTDAS